MTSTEISSLLDEICGDNDYALAFQTTQELRDLAAEIKRLWTLTKIEANEWQSTDLEPLLGVLTAFIIDLDVDISRQKQIIEENISKAPNENGNAEYNDMYVSYLEDIKSGAVRSRDRVVEYQLMMIKKITFA